MSDFPRLLIVSPSAFNNLSGGGITFSNLFRGWPSDRIATVTNDHIPVTNDVCKKYYFLSRKEFPWVFPFSLINAIGYGQEKLEKNLKTLEHRSLGTMKRVAQLFFGDELPAAVRLSEPLKKWICEFKPEVLYSILGNLPYIRLVSKIADEFDLPIVIHMMDDWPQTLYRRGIFGPYRKFRMENELKKLMDRASTCLSICDSMSEAFQHRYQKPFKAFHNSLEAQEWTAKARKNWRAGSPFVLLYAGALMPNSQLESVRDTCDAVSRLRLEGLDIEFYIHAPWFFANRYRTEFERFSGVKVFDAPETMDIESLFTKADLLLLPVNFDEPSVRYIRYSMPTKVPAYMFSGTPTLAYGPFDVASIQYAEKWAYVVSERKQEVLKEAIHHLVTNENMREELALRAQKLGVARHDAEAVRRAFHKIFMEAGQKP